MHNKFVLSTLPDETRLIIGSNIDLRVWTNSSEIGYMDEENIVDQSHSMIYVSASNTILSGNVGIGTHLPDVELHVQGAIKSTSLDASRVLLTDASNKIVSSGITSNVLSYMYGVTSSVQTQLDDKLPLSGGTLSGSLHVNGDFTASNLTIVGETTILNTVSSNTENMVINNAGSGPALKVTQAGLLDVHTVAEFYDAENVAPALFIANGGNVGLGTAIPLSKMHVEGDVAVRGNIIPADNVTYDLGSDTKRWRDLYLSGTTINLGGVLIQKDQDTGGVQFVTETDSMASTKTNDMIVYGNLGVGTDTPLAPIHFTGDIRNDVLVGSRVLVTDENKHIASSTVTSYELSHLSGSRCNIQTQIDNKQDTITGAASSVASSNLYPSMALISDANGKIDAGTATAAQIGYLSDVTSPIQSQIDSKQATITGAASTIVTNNFNANYVLVSNGSGKVAESSVTTTKLNTLSNITSSVQDQLNTKQSTITGAASSIVMDNLNSDLVLVSSGSGKVSASAISTSELNSLDGITDNVQTQINNRLALSGGTLSGALTVNANLSAYNITASNLTIVGDAVVMNTTTSNTEQMVITNAGTGPALKVVQTGSLATHSIAEFVDAEDGSAMFISNGGNIGMGTTSPGYKLDIYDKSNKGFSLTEVNNTDGSLFEGRRARGTAIETPQAVQTDDRMAGLRGWGYNGTSYALSGAVSVRASENFTATSNGSYVTITTTPNGSTTGTERIRVTNDGNLGIGLATPLSKLHVNGDLRLPYASSIRTGGSATDKLTETGWDSTFGDYVYLYTPGNVSSTVKLSLFSSGVVGIGTTSPANVLTVVNRTGQYEQNIKLLPSSHASSKRAGIEVDEWVLGQDANGTGTKDFFIYHGGSTNKQRMIFKTDGNVGVGTGDPQAKFDIVAGTKTQAPLFLRNNLNSNVSLQFWSDDGTLDGSLYEAGRIETGWDSNVTAWNAMYMKFQTHTGNNSAYADTLTLRGSGVGIGTTNPLAELHIHGSDELLRITDGTRTIYAGCDANEPWFGTSTNNGLRLIANGYEKARITADGKFGIGTAFPQNTLDVNGYARCKGELVVYSDNVNEGGQITLGYQNTSIVSQSNGTWNLDVLNSRFRIHNTTLAGGLSEALTLLENGNLGVGISTPGYKLHISGDIVATGDVTGFGSASDGRFKEGVTELDATLTQIRKLRPVDFKWSSNVWVDEKRGTEDVGFIAQEVENVFPKLMKHMKVNESDGLVKGIAYEKFAPYMIKAIQELDAENASLKEEMSELRKEIAEIKASLKQ